jgi:hypothetical protein
MANPRNKKNLMSFNAGELSPKLDARVDTEKYAAGCRQCQNMIPMPHGGVTRRKGFEFVAAAKYDATDKPIRLLDFQFSRTVAFMLEMGNLYIRFYYLGNQIQSGGVAYEITSPYTAEQCAEIQYVQINDVVYITHPAHPVQKLSRLANDSWTLVEVDFDRPPFLDENLTAVTIDPSGTTGTISLVASSATFEAGHVGAYFNIGHRRESTSTEIPITGVSTSATVLVTGRWFFRTFGIWAATVTVQRSVDGTTNWETVRSYTGKKDRNLDVEGEEEDQAYYRINITAFISQTHTHGEDSRAVFELEDRFIYGVVKITAVTNSTNATATVKRALFSEAATQYWAEGSWSPLRGYPAACAFYENRMFFAGTTYQPQTLWGSIVDDYENFTAGTADDDAVAFTLSSTERQQVLWMVSQSRLVIGTTSGEWTASGGDLNSSITPTKIEVRQQSNFGSQAGRALLVNDTILFVQRSGRKLREAVYDAIKEGYQSNDVTILSDHITAGGIKSPAYQSDRDSIFWAIANGNLIGMTYEKEQSVIAWHRHTTAGTFESVETIYGTLDDEVWVSVLRTINGVQKRFIERMTGYYNPSVDAYPEKPKQQVAFLVDTTGSMGGIIDSVIAEIPAIAQMFYAQNLNSEFSIIGFKDEDDNPVFDPNTGFIPYGEISSSLQGITADGGGDGPENGYGAIVQAMSQLEWDDDSDKFVILFTDFRSHERGATKAQALAALLGKEAKFFHGTHSNSDYADLSSDTGGGVISSIGNVVDLIGLETTFSGRDTEKTFVDSCIVYASVPATIITGLSHLNGETVDILADGAVHPLRVVSGGQIELEYAASIVHVGLGYESIIKPMRLDVDDAAGNTQGAVKNIRGVTLRLMDTLGLKVTDLNEETFREVEFRTTEDNMDAAPPLFTGDKYHEVDGDYDEDATIILKQDQPLPWTLLGMVIHYQITGTP